MAEMITTGIWVVHEDKQAAFMEAWAALAGWATTMPGAGTLRLGREVGDPTRFVSFGAWESPELVHAWKANSEFREHMAQVLQYVDDFRPSELDVVAGATGGRSQIAVSNGR